MKKIFLVFLLAFSMIFTLTACSSGSSSDADTTGEEDVEVDEEYIDTPMSDATDDKGLAGTWENDTTTDDVNEYTILALNTDDTFELYTETSDSESAFMQALVSGTYKDDGSKLTFTYDEDTIERVGDENEPNAPKTTLGDSNDATYKLDGDKLTLTIGSKTIEFDRIPVEDTETETTEEVTEDTDNGEVTETVETENSTGSESN